MADIERRRAGDPLDMTERKSPLQYLPEEWRGPVAFFCAFHGDLLKGQAGIVARLRLWIKDEGLTLDEMRHVMRRLMRPAESARFEYAGQLLAAIAAEVDSVIQTRRRREETEQRRATEQRERTTAAAPDEIRQLLGRIGAVGQNDA